MSDAITAPAGEVPPVPVATPAPAAPVAAPISAVAPVDDPKWLAARLEQNERALLKKLGVENVTDVEKAMVDYRAKLEADKSEATKNAERIAELTKANGRLAEVEGVVKARADIELSGLDEAKRAAVKAIAGEDPAKVLSAIDALKPTWVTAPVVAPVTPATPVVVQPASTAPARTAPGGDAASPVDHKAVYDALKTKNPFQAADYLTAHAQEIYPASN